MRIEMMPTDRMAPHNPNARTLTADQVAQIAEFGFTNPILIGASELIITEAPSPSIPFLQGLDSQNPL